jgi:UPF0716 protein FxsA
MTWRTRAVLLGYPLIELVTIFLVAQWIGWGWTLLLLVAGLPIGFGIMRNAGGAAMADLQAAAQTGSPAPGQGRHAVTMLAGLLIAIPGFWTDLAGLLLVLPPIQRMVRARAGAWVEPRMSRMRMPGYDPRGFSGDVVEGTVIRVEDLRQEPPEPPRQLP